MKHETPFLFVAGLAFTVPLFAQDAAEASGSATQTQTVSAPVVRVAMGKAPKSPLAPLSRSATLTAGIPADLGHPEGLHPRFSGKLDIAGNSHAVIAAATDKDAKLPDVVLVDCDHDGHFDGAEWFKPKITEQSANGRTMIQSESFAVSMQTGAANLTADVRYMGLGDTARLMFNFAEQRVASVTIGGETHVLAIADGDFDGVIGGARDLWTIAKEDARPRSSMGLPLVGEGIFADGVRWTIQCDGDRVSVQSAKADGPNPADEAAVRVRVEHEWAERFDAEREGFVAQRKLDTSRKLATKPIEWRYVTFEQGLAMAKAEQKLLFIDVMAFWCVWCYRMDYYTYPDAEVADYLTANFIPVKIIQEQDRVGDYQKLMDTLKLRGIPAMGVFDGDGAVVHPISGWKAPTDFLAELRKAKGE
ncbi:MAG: thioredoxin family protein [Planctomycetota bacterium]